MYLLIFSYCSFHNSFSPWKIIWEKQYLTSARLCVCCISAEIVRASTCNHRLAYKRFLFPDCLKLSVFKLCREMFHASSHFVPKASIKQWIPAGGVHNNQFRTWLYRYAIWQILSGRKDSVQGAVIAPQNQGHIFKADNRYQILFGVRNTTVCVIVWIY